MVYFKDMIHNTIEISAYYLLVHLHQVRVFFLHEMHYHWTFLLAVSTTSAPKKIPQAGGTDHNPVLVHFMDFFEAHYLLFLQMIFFWSALSQEISEIQASHHNHNFQHRNTWILTWNSPQWWQAGKQTLCWSISLLSKPPLSWLVNTSLHCDHPLSG